MVLQEYWLIIIQNHLFCQEYREEMSRMDAERQALIADGHCLMRNSSEIRATDIEYKISKLTDKWQKLEAMMANRWGAMYGVI